MHTPATALMIMVCLTGLLVVAAVLRRVRSRAILDADMAWRPLHLRRAQLVYAEKTFRCSTPFALAAKVDRVYRAQGQLHLIELKTRSHRRIYQHDVIELSAQRVAIQASTGESVADTGYVLIKLPGGPRLHRMRVRLMSEADVVNLARRREHILAGGIASCETESKGLCRKCAYAEPCGRG